MGVIERSLIDVLLEADVWKGLSVEEKATEYRERQVRQVVEIVRAHDHQGAVDLLRWALPYLPEPLPSMEGGAYAENYNRAMTLSANTPTGGQ